MFVLEKLELPVKSPNRHQVTPNNFTTACVMENRNKPEQDDSGKDFSCCDETFAKQQS